MLKIDWIFYLTCEFNMDTFETTRYISPLFHRSYRFYRLRQYLRTTSSSYARCISLYNPCRVSWFYFSPDSITYRLCTITQWISYTLAPCAVAISSPFDCFVSHGECPCRAVTSLIPSSINYSFYYEHYLYFPSHYFSLFICFKR